MNKKLRMILAAVAIVGTQLFMNPASAEEFSKAKYDQISAEIEQDPKNAELYYKRGMYLMDCFGDNIYGTYRMIAFANFTLAIRYDPNFAEAYCARGRIFNNVDKFERDFRDAAADLNKAIELKPDYADAWMYRGKLVAEAVAQKSQEGNAGFFAQYNFKRSLREYVAEDFDKAIQIDPSNFRYRFERGQALARIDDFRHALEDYDICIANGYTADGMVYFRRGQAHYYYSKYLLAIEDFTKAIEELKDDTYLSLAYYLRGVAHNDRKEYRDALSDYLDSLKYDPKDTTVLLKIAKMKEKHFKDYEGALEYYEKILELKPNDKDALKGKKRMEKQISKQKK